MLKKLKAKQNRLFLASVRQDLDEEHGSGPSGENVNYMRMVMDNAGHIHKLKKLRRKSNKRYRRRSVMASNIRKKYIKRHHKK